MEVHESESSDETFFDNFRDGGKPAHPSPHPKYADSNFYSNLDGGKRVKLYLVCKILQMTSSVVGQVHKIHGVLENLEWVKTRSG